MQATTEAALIGTYRTFGKYGPVYEVLRSAGSQKVRIVVVETGEEIDYPTDQALEDPMAN